MIASAGRAMRICVAAGFVLLLGALVICLHGSEGIAAASESSELPTAADIAEGLATVEKEEAKAEVALAQPEAILERQESETAFEGLDLDEARNLLHARFSEQFDILNADPARLLSDAILQRVLEGGEAAAIVNDGRPQLLDAGAPVVALDEGEMQKVDLTLVSEGGGLAPENPIVPVALPEEADEAVLVGDHGLGIAAVGVSGDSSAELFGDKNAFYFDARDDTDLIVSPIAEGVELFEQLRSAGSPEKLQYAIEMPADAELSSDGNGGAQITRGDTTLGRIPFPTAVDAQGTQVSVDLEVESDSITLSVPHRNSDFAYPILVDPALVEDWSSCNWYNGCNLGALDDPNVWVWDDSKHGWIYHDRTCFWSCWGSGRGLYIGGQWGGHGPNEWGHWTYTPPGASSWISSATFNPFWRNNYNCSKSSFPQPHDYDGLWSPSSGWVPIETNRANDYGHAAPTGYGRVAVVGLGTAGGWAYNNCNRTIMLAGVSVAITDSDVPTWNADPTVADQWTDTAVVPVNVSASDPGLGMKWFNLFAVDAQGKAVAPLLGNSGHPCSGLRANPCPASWSSQIANYNPATLPNGVNPMVTFAYDALGVGYDPNNQVHNSQGKSVFIKVDHSKPTIAKSGELFGPSPNVYKGEIVATDGSAAALNSAQSGMKSVQFYVDKQLVGRYPDEANPPACNKPQQGINMASCQFKLPIELSRTLFGKHEFEVKAFDSLNHETKESFFLELPKDVTGPSLTVTGPLKNAAGGWLTNGATTVTLEAKDAAAGVIEEAVYVDGTSVAKATQECFAGGCGLIKTLNVSLASYGNGPHTVKAVAKDSVGNVTETSWAVNVDANIPTLDSVTAPDLPEGWTPQLSSFNLNYAASDSGSGVKKVEITRPSSTGTTLTSYPFNSSCTGTVALPCPATASGTTAISATTMAQGINNVTVKAYDATGRVSSAKTVTVFIDRSAPAIVSAYGALVEGSTDLIGVATDLDVTVQDFGSGVASLEILVDDELVEARTLDELLELGAQQTCGGESCQLTYATEALVGAGLEPGPHTVELLVKDEVGQSDAWTKQVVIDTTTPVVQLSGSLHDSQGEELPGPTGTLEVSADDGADAYDAGVLKIEFAVDGEPIDPKADLVVVDENNNRIEEFGEDGSFIRAFGTTGSGDGQLNRPAGAAVDASGNIWVSDANNHRIQKFSEAGLFLAKVGSYGFGNGQFNGPEGLAIAPGGNIWVADTYNGRLQVFNPSGGFVKTVSSKGSGTGQLGEPTGLDFGPSGTVWVADWQNNRVAVFNEVGEFIRQFGSAGTGNGQFNRPDAIDVDSQGNVWVGDQNNGRVQVFNQQGEYITQFGSKGSAAGQFNFGYPFGLERDSQGAIWVADANNHRIQKWTMPLSGGTAQPNYTTPLGSGGTGNGQFNHPANIALDAKGNLWVVDEYNHRVQAFSETGTFIRAFGTVGSGDGQLNRPTGITVDPKGYVWVSDANNHRIQKFSESGTYLAKVGSYGTGNGQFNGPEGIVTDAKGNLWVSDTYNGRLQVFNEKGEFVKTVSSKGSATGQLGEPTGIDVGPGGKIWVADWQNNRVAVFNESGEFVRQFGTAGTGNGQFNRPDAIDVDSRGTVWVGDQNNGRVQAFNQQGDYLTQFGSAGTGTGQFSFGYPMGIVSDSRGNIWVSDTGNNRLQKWTVPNYRPSYANSFGSYGSGNGQFNHPADLALTAVHCTPGTCPAQVTDSFTFDESEWGPGPHTVTVTVTDGVGNVDVEEIRVNEPLNVVAPECPTAQPEVLSGGQALGASAVVSGLEGDLPGAVAPIAAGNEGILEPEVTDEPIGVSLNEMGIDVTGSIAGGGIEDASAGAFTVGQAACLQPLETSGSALPPTVVEDTAVVYPNALPDTDVVIRPTASGTTILQRYRGEDAPTETSWKLDLEPGQELVELENGSIAVVTPGGVDLDLGDVPPAPEGGMSALNNATEQMAQAQYDLAAAHEEVEGEVNLVVAVPEAITASNEVVQGVLRISGASVVTAELPPNAVAEIEAMIIRANPPAEPESICASVVARAPKYASRVCEGWEEEEEDVEDGGNPLGMYELASTGTSGEDNEIIGWVHTFEQLAYPPGVTAFSGSGGKVTKQQLRFCEKYPGECSMFDANGINAALVEDALFNIEVDGSMGNAFRHTFWVAQNRIDEAWVGHGLGYAMAHEEDQWKSKKRSIRNNSRMDKINNTMGYKRADASDIHSCENMFLKAATRSHYIGRQKDPLAWIKENQYKYFAPIFRIRYSGGTQVYPTGIRCKDVL
jgi:sugar lactone lactonase YvrE